MRRWPSRPRERAARAAAERASGVRPSSWLGSVTCTAAAAAPASSRLPNSVVSDDSSALIARSRSCSAGPEPGARPHGVAVVALDEPPVLGVRGAAPTRRALPIRRAVLDHRAVPTCRAISSRRGRRDATHPPFLRDRLDAGEQRGVEPDRVGVRGEQRRHLGLDRPDALRAGRRGEHEEHGGDAAQDVAGAFQGDDRVLERRRRGVGGDRVDLGALAGHALDERGEEVLLADGGEVGVAERQGAGREEGVGRHLAPGRS